MTAEAGLSLHQIVINHSQSAKIHAVGIMPASEREVETALQPPGGLAHFQAACICMYGCIRCCQATLLQFRCVSHTSHPLISLLRCGKGSETAITASCVPILKEVHRIPHLLVSG